MNKPIKKLTIASASQNLDTKSERVIHRLIPMLVAENMTRISEYYSGKAMPRMDLWNCVGIKLDKAFQNQSEYVSRRDFSSALIEDKYTILGELGVPREGRCVIRDDDAMTKTWLKSKIEQLISSEIIYQESASVNMCDNCDYLQSLHGTAISSCTRCDYKDFHPEEREVLIVDIPEYRASLIENCIIHPKNTNHIQSFFDQLPPRMMISKVREYGLSLDSIGLQEFVLDPKIGVALMPELVAEMNNLSEITLVQGATVATNALPYTSLMSTGFQHKYVLLPKIPITTLEEARSIGLSFVGRYLPFILMEYRDNLNPAQLETAREEYSRITWKVDNILHGMRSGREESVDLKPEDHQMLSEIVQDFSNYNIRDGRKKLNGFFRSQGKRYAEELRVKGVCLNPKDIGTLEDIVRLFYG